MAPFIASLIVFLLTASALGVTIWRGNGRQECNCKRAARIVRDYKTLHCNGCSPSETPAGQLVQLDGR